MTEDEAYQAALWLGKMYPDINPDQVRSWQLKFLEDIYADEDVRAAAHALRPTTNYFNTERFNAIWNRIRLERITPEERKRIAENAKKQAAEQAANNPNRIEQQAILDRKKRIEQRLNELGMEERVKLAQQCIDRLPEQLRGLLEKVAALKGDPFSIASIREEAGEILEVK